MEITARIYKNRTNGQLSLIPTKKNLSPRVMALLENPDIAGFRLKIIKKIKRMPPVEFKTSEEARRKVRSYKSYKDRWGR